MRTIARVLDAPLAERPHATAVVARSGTLTYRQLDAAADASAAALWAGGVRPGDRVAACLPNDLGVVAAFHGAQRIGAIWVGIGEALTEPEQRLLAEDCAPAAILAGPQCKLSDPAAITEGQWSELCASAPAAPRVESDAHAPAGIAYTSGTTGQPKGIVHSQHNLLLPGAVLNASRGWGPSLRKGDCLPLTILNMLVLTTLLTAQAGGCCIVMDRRDAEGIAEWVSRERIGVWNGAPAQLYDLARHPELDLSALTEIWAGGGDCSEQLRKTFHTVHGRHVRATYGLTEAPTVVAIDPVGEEWQGSASGRVLPHLEVAARGGDGGVLPPGTEGELHIAAASSGPWAGAWTPMLGVWEDGGVRPAADAGLTGDIGTVDADGWLSVVGRKKVVVVRGGANVYPAEVERVLTAAPEVAAAAVFGVPDERLGERVAALVQPVGGHIDLDKLRADCSRELARYKVPEIWKAVPLLPTNAMGKVIRTGLADLLGDARYGHPHDDT
ncbi:MAG TPA: class I adenylate-forming enzyme family protein [Frankiaceae bacterium]|nr:class I adenylate-forming enzyme family protein [Frankiaceae bacterium]